MNLFALLLLVSLGLVTTSCSRKKASDRAEHERAEESREHEGRESGERSRETADVDEVEDQPESEEIGEDCVAFLRATTAGPGNREKTGDCPECPPRGAIPEVLKFDDLKVDRISPSGDRCEVAVRIFATFNPSTRNPIVGGLTAWISPEQKRLYELGEVPSEQQVYKVNVVYRRKGKGWRPVEFH